jgi:outer membrane protein OmpA-like peptidoglycan-associated protein
MSKVSAILVAGATSFMLSACADDFNVKEITSGGFGFKDSYDTASATQPMGSDFNRNLYSGYMDLAAAERSEYDWRDSGYFSSKALSAAQDQTVTPDSIASRDLPEESVAELAGAHAQLTAALQGGAATRAPSDAAKAQVSFDCWIQEQEENHQPEDWLACRESFNQAMARLKGVGGNNYVVFFDFDSMKVDRQAEQVIMDAASAAKLTGGKILVSGHADRAGDAAYNMALSQRRVEAVREMLLSAGIKLESISTTQYGESQPRLATGENEPAKENRRVEISLFE